MKEKDKTKFLERFTLILFVIFILVLLITTYIYIKNPNKPVPLDCRLQCESFNKTAQYIDGNCRCIFGTCNLYFNNSINISSCKT